MDYRLQHHIDLLIKRYPVLEECVESIKNTYDILEECFAGGHKLLIAGNGGSNSDAEHIAGELMKSFRFQRKCSKEFADELKSVDKKRGEELAEKLQCGLPVIVLSCHQSLNTAFINDVYNGGLFTYAQQVHVYANKGDVLLSISTSGESKNVLNATIVALAKGLKVIGLTGENGGELSRFSSVSIKVPAQETYIIQELHLPVYHCLCLMLEEFFFAEK